MRLQNVPDSDLLHVAITGPDVMGARTELHIPTRRFVADYEDYDRATGTSTLTLGETISELRSRGYDYIAVGSSARP